MRTAKVISVSLPPEMEREVQQIAKAERRSVSEVLREAIRQYSANRDLAAIRSDGKKIAKRKKLKREDVTRVVREGRPVR
jgi:Arc/MetJ-type ribon-helix-helix transcriptional regulator